MKYINAIDSTPVQNAMIAVNSLIVVGSISTYSAIPPQTPQMTLSSDLVNFLFIFY